MAFGFTPAIAEKSPLHAGAYAVTQALCKIAASGADALSARLSLQEYFESLKQNPDSWGKPVASLLGALMAQVGFGTPAIGGKDSMSGTFKEYNAADAGGLCHCQDQSIAAVLGYIGEGAVCGAHPAACGCAGAAGFCGLCRALQSGIQSAPGRERLRGIDGGRGRPGRSCRKMCFGNGVGFAFEGTLDHQTLFAWRVGDLLIASEDKQALLQLPSAELVGHTTEEAVLSVNGIKVPLAALEKAWRAPLETVFPTETPFTPPMQTVPLYTERQKKRPSAKMAKPRVLIPRLAGHKL